MDLRTVYQNPYGSIVFTFGSGGISPHGMSSEIVNHKRLGQYLIYCDFGVSITRNNFQLFNSAWGAPYNLEVWGCLGLVVGVLILILRIHTTLSPSQILLAMCALCFRQKFIKLRVIQLTALVSIPILAIYESYFASKLIAPVRVTQFSSLKEILEHDIEIYGIKPPPGGDSLRNLLHNDFEMLGYLDKLNSSVFEIADQNTLSLLRVLSPSTPNRSIIFLADNIDFILNYAQNVVLRGQYKCHKIANFAIINDFFDLLLNMFESEMRQIVRKVDGAGLPKLWKEWLDFFYEVIAPKNRILWVEAGRIGMSNLISLVLVNLMLLIVSGIIFLFEIR